MIGSADPKYQFSVGSIFVLITIAALSLALLTGVVNQDAGLMILGAIAGVVFAMYGMVLLVEHVRVRYGSESAVAKPRSRVLIVLLLTLVCFAGSELIFKVVDWLMHRNLPI